MHTILSKWNPEFAHAQLQSVTPRVWRIQYGERTFVLKRRSDHTSVWAEYNLLSWLRSKGMPVLAPILSIDGVPWVHHGGDIYVLYPFIEGKAGQEVCPTDLTKAYNLGKFLAELHACLAQYPQTSDFPVRNVYGEVTTWAWPTVRRCLSGDLRARLDDIGASISKFSTLYEILPQQLIHRDAHPGNVVFVGDEVVGMVDFDLVRMGVRLFDLCYCATAVLSNCFTKGPVRESWDSFVQELLRGYVQVQPLSRSEGYAFMYMTYLVQVLFAAYFFDAGQDDLATQNVAILAWLYDRQNSIEPLIDKVIRNKEEGLNEQS